MSNYVWAFSRAGVGGWVSDLPSPHTHLSQVCTRSRWTRGQRAAAGLLQLAALAGPLHKLALVGGEPEKETEREREIHSEREGAALADAIFVQRQRQLNNFYACLHISTMDRTDAKFERKLSGLRRVQHL